MFWFNAILSRRGISGTNEKRAPRKSKAFQGARTPAIDTLEPRRLLSASVNTSTFEGPLTATGVVWNYQTLANGTVFETNTQRVIGPATFDDQNDVRIDSTGLEPAAQVVTTTQSFYRLTSVGLVTDGSTVATFDNGSETNVTTTYSPAKDILPPKMVPGQGYMESTTSTQQITGASIGTVVTKQSAIFTLESAKQSVRVPAGKYTAYVIDESITTSSVETVPDVPPITSGPTTSTGKAYYVPNVGLVELAIGSGVTELVSFNSKGVGALTGRMTGALPKTSLTAGQKARISQKLTLTDSGTGALKEAVSVSYFFSTGTSVDSSSIPLPGQFTAHLNLKGSKHVVYNFHLTTVPAATPNGTYYIVAEATEPDGTMYDIPSASQVTVGPA